MSEELVTSTIESSNDTDSEMVNSLVWNMLSRPAIQEELKSIGFNQLEKPYLGFVYDKTHSPDLTPEQELNWQEEKEKALEQYWRDLPEERKEIYNSGMVEYRKAVEYMKEPILETLELIKTSKFGLKEIFQKHINNEKITSQNVIDIMKEKGVVVEENPEKEQGWGLKGDNNGISRYRSGKWHVKLNKIALNDPRAILHELYAVELFDSLIQENPKIGDILTGITYGVMHFLKGFHFQEAQARGKRFFSKQMSLHILEGLYVNLVSIRRFYPQFQEYLE
jgi:hypothetical protein